MSEESAIYRLDVAEQRARADGLEELYRKASVEANQLRIRLRELEDAIILHRERLMRDITDVDVTLWREVPESWS